MKRFALIGLGGYIAEKHLKAIKETGNELVAAMDTSDSVGIIDSYFPEADFFTEFERFERHLEKLHRSGKGVDFLTVCTPNYLHDSHIRLGLRVGADVICEKPVTIKPENLKAVSELARSLNRRVYTIMQMRLHPLIGEIRKQTETGISKPIFIEYTAPRGTWYDYSWKGDVNKSGGLIYNLGIHFLDLLIQLFGEHPTGSSCIGCGSAFGSIWFLETATVDWELSNKGPAKRILTINDIEYDFTNGFTDLHTKCYESILAGEKLFDIDSAYPAIKLAEELSNYTPDSDN